MKTKPLILDGNSLTCDALIKHLESRNEPLSISRSGWAGIERSSTFFDKVQREGTRCYGLNTGFGDLIDFTIPSDEQDAMQKRLVLSHAIGAKEPLGLKCSQAIFLLRLNCLAKGASGIRPQTVKRLLELYNNEAFPEIYKSGSLGASGDLAPLSHFAAFSIGHGWGYLKGKRMRSSEIHHRLKLAPLVLARKEGLSLINGTSAMVAVAVEAIHKIQIYLETTLIGSVLLLNKTNLSDEFIHLPAYALKKHKGSWLIAKYLQRLNRRRKNTGNKDFQGFQAPYSFRCLPYLLGSLVDSLISCREVLEIEMNSANDNPLFIEETNSLYHGGHFHGHPISVELDQFRIAAVHLSGVMDRQLEFLMDRKRNFGTRGFFSIAPEKGYSGLEGAQYLATSLHIENKILAAPVSFQTIPSNAGNQDYVSLGLQSALATLEMANNINLILSVYLFSALQAFNLDPNHLSPKHLAPFYELLGEHYGRIYRDDRVIRELIVDRAEDSLYKKLCGLSRDKKILIEDFT